jgi:hypothetical protein
MAPSSQESEPPENPVRFSQLPVSQLAVGKPGAAMCGLLGHDWQLTLRSDRLRLNAAPKLSQHHQPETFLL